MKLVVAAVSVDRCFVPGDDNPLDHHGGIVFVPYVERERSEVLEVSSCDSDFAKRFPHGCIPPKKHADYRSQCRDKAPIDIHVSPSGLFGFVTGHLNYRAVRRGLTGQNGNKL